MPPKEDGVYVGHMLDTAQKALRLAKGKSREDFDHDETLHIALAHLIQVIGEAARRVSKEFCDAHPEIPWKAIVGMRHKVVHDYMDIDEDIVWDTVKKELKPLVDRLKKISFSLILFLFSWNFLLAQTKIPLTSGTPDEIVSSIDEVVSKNIKDKSTLATLVEALTSAETDVRVKERAAWALGQLKAESAEKTLMEAAQNKGLLVRAAALNSLIHLRSKAALPIYIDVAKSDPILSLRQKATIALGLLKSDKAIDTLVKLSDDPREEVRGAAVLSMGALHSSKNNFSEIVGGMAKDPSPYVQERAQSALEIIQGKNPIVQNHLRADDSDVRLFAALYFRSKGKQADLKALKAAQNSEADDEVRSELAEAVKATQKRVAAAKAQQKKAQTAANAAKSGGLGGGKSPK